LSIGRGAWKFARGDWTTIRQDIWLNTPGQNDGGFNIWINGQLVMNAGEVRYRENAASCNIDTLSVAQDPPAAAMSTSSSFSTSASTESTAPTSSIVSAASTTPTSFDDGSYTWSAPPEPAPTRAQASSAAWKRQTDTMMRGDPFFLDTPSLTPEGLTSLSLVPTTSSAWAEPTTSPIINSPNPDPTTALSQAAQDCSIGFIGLFFSTFFGGHTDDWSPSSDQYTYFKEFQMWINA
jgi:hypothetical protein